MSRIDVVQNGNRYMVMVNFIQHGVILSSLPLANSEAQKVKTNIYPFADLHILSTVKT